MSENEFKIGDVIILKSGGPGMTVEEVDDEEDTVHCQWFVNGKKLEDGWFPADSLKRYVEPQVPMASFKSL